MRRWRVKSIAIYPAPELSSSRLFDLERAEPPPRPLETTVCANLAGGFFCRREVEVDFRDFIGHHGDRLCLGTKLLVPRLEDVVTRRQISDGE